MHFRALLAATVLIASLASPATPETAKLVEVRIGLGYGFDGESTVLTEPLPRRNPEIVSDRTVPAYPDACFSPPGITSMGQFPMETNEQITAFTRVFIFGGDIPSITCGEESLSFDPYIEVRTEDGDWLIFNTAGEDFLNGYVERYFEKAFVARHAKKMNLTYEALESGGARIIDDEGDESFRFGVRSGHFVVYFPTSGETGQSDFKALTEAFGYDPIIPDPPQGERDDWPVVVPLDRLDREVFFGGLRRAVIKTIGLTIAQMDYEIHVLDTILSGRSVSTIDKPAYFRSLAEKHGRE